MRRSLSVLKQPLEVLGLNPTTQYNANEIRGAFRARAKTLHPDVGGDPERFRELRWAYEHLTGQFGRLGGPLESSSGSGFDCNSTKQRPRGRIGRLRLRVFYEHRSHSVPSRDRNKGICCRFWEGTQLTVRKYMYELPLSRISTRGLYLLRWFNYHHPMGQALAEDDVTAANRLTRLAITWCIIRYRLLWVVIVYLLVYYSIYQRQRNYDESTPHHD